MKWLLGIVLVVMLLGPLRPWFGRHWAFLFSVIFGAIVGWILAAIVVIKTGPQNPLLPWAWSIVLALACGYSGPAWLRKIGKDGKDE